MLAALCTGCALAETGSPGTISDSTASVGGRVLSTVGGEVEYWVQYGPTAAYGAETAHAKTTVQANAGRTVTVQIGGLTRSTRYHYRLCASDSQQDGGPHCGADRPFTTQSFACGETVTTSVRLTGAAFCESSVAVLVVGANGIDINLAGYPLSTPSGSGGGSDAIVNDGGFSDVTIRNGTITGRIRLEGASRNLIRDVIAAGGSDVVRIEGGEANEIRASTILGRGSGVSAAGSEGLVVVNSHVTGGLGSAIQVAGDQARIARNEVPLENPGGFVSGIALTGSGNRVVDNLVTGPWPAGGIALFAGADNAIVENEVFDAGIASTPPGDHFGDGIFVGDFTAGTLLRDNRVERSFGDGIEVRGPSARVGGNTALDNGDFGIDAAAGATDLGGNSASGNGNPLQCRNVFCS